MSRCHVLLGLGEMSGIAVPEADLELCALLRDRGVEFRGEAIDLAQHQPEGCWAGGTTTAGCVPST
ncbi:hypothetical protein J2S53_003997 [Actinopolyspora lacussalsi]|nr:hypothetical protein [Actinopolyspora lacussalsi]